MTRINSAIPVKCLTDEHLLAEHREIKRLPACFMKARTSGALKRIPAIFRLGTSHVTFFLDKFRFTYRRYLAIHAECLSRGFNVEDYHGLWSAVKSVDLWKDHKPTEAEHTLLVNRISERILESKKSYFHYCGRAVSKNEAINLLTNEIYK